MKMTIVMPIVILIQTNLTSVTTAAAGDDDLVVVMMLWGKGEGEGGVRGAGSLNKMVPGGQEVDGISNRARTEV